ncbi:MAG: LCP family protein [Clostridia bacterium]|nr:LCP family protein [Clostridia bacterium]
MKRIFSLLLALCLLVPATFAHAATPKPIEVIPFDQLPETRDGMHHYLLLCVDQWNSSPSRLGNTDGIMILTLDTRANRIMLTSLIRDALVVRPDGVIGRVNYIAANYGPEALCKVLSEHLGIRIEKYVLFDFQQIANIVDYMGGVEIVVDASEARYLREYPLDAHQTEPKMNRAGTYLFTGRAAVIYMRIRKAGGGGDFMRTQRARTVLSTLADKCRTMTYNQARDLVDIVVANTTMTNMTIEDMVLAMEQAYGLRSCVIEELRIPQEDAVSPISYAGMSVQEIDWIKSREDVADYMECSWLVIDDEEYED